ncbi:MAG: UDP-N-acetylmuramate dehydrogenase [Atopobiaceae bacterium]|nr:UDP-N-acetylmuramate dehydrogenase [Atopobiaceae bacterium]
MSDSGELSQLRENLERIVGEDNVIENELLSKHTSFEIGGPADLFVIPETVEQLAQTVIACRRAAEPYLVLGRGSDLLVGDGGFRGVVIALAEALGDVTVDGNRLCCQAGVTLADAAVIACTLGLSGLEFASGIPGTVGGAVFMNAGAYDGEIKQVLESARVLLKDGRIEEMTTDELEMGYRTSRVRTEGLVVLDATFSLTPADSDTIKATMDDLQARRADKQPLELPSAGSTFKRPEGYFAGKLISDAGLQGQSVGGAQVSTKHAGFIVNTGGATASDVRKLIELVQSEVKRQFDVNLETEVIFVGEFDETTQL